MGQQEGQQQIAHEVKIRQFLMHQKQGFKLLLKQGSKGSTLLWIEGNGEEAVLQKESVPVVNFREHPDVQLVDTTGAGDTYTAAFAVKYAQLLAENKQNTNTAHSVEDILGCMRFATRAAFMCITKFGAATAIPNSSELESRFSADCL